jgi:hypothetical protein
MHIKSQNWVSPGMGLKATCVEGHITITDGDVVVKRWYDSHWRSWKEEAHRVGDYVEYAKNQLS